MKEQWQIDLETRLGHPIVRNGGREISFDCPFCINSNLTADIKSHLYVSLDKKIYHCFRCGAKGTLTALFKYLNINKSFSYVPTQTVPIQYQPKVLPQGYREIFPLDNVFSTMFYDYLHNRGIVDEDIKFHKMGYTIEGKYAWRIIIPAYNYGNLEFFTARANNDKIKPKYLNPSWSKDNAIFNLERALNSDGDIIICEGIFSALAIGKNAVAMFGKNVMESQLQRVLKGIKRTGQGITIALDGDAKPQSLKIADLLLSWGYEDTKIWLYKNKKDPSEDNPIEIIDYADNKEKNLLKLLKVGDK